MATRIKIDASDADDFEAALDAAFNDGRKEFKKKLAEDRNAERAEQAAGFGSQATGAAGQGAAGLAGNSVMPAFEGAIKVASSGLEALGPWGAAASKGLQGVAEAANTIKVVVDSFAQRAKELEQFSPNIAASSARADVRRMQTDMTEAQELGPQLAALLDSQSKIEAMVSATLLPIKEFVLQNLNEFLKWSMETFADFIAGLNEALKAIRADSAALTRLVAKIRDIMDEKDPMSPLDAIMGAARGFAAPGRPADAGAMPGGFLPPIVGGFRDGVDAGRR